MSNQLVCPYCDAELNPGAISCRCCGRDLTPVLPLLRRLDAAERRITGLEEARAALEQALDEVRRFRAEAMPAPAAQGPGQLRGMARMPAQSAPAPVRPIPVAHSRPTQPVAIPTHFTAPPPLQPFTHVVAQPAAPMATTAAPIGHIRFGTRPIVLSKADVQPAIAVDPANVQPQLDRQPSSSASTDDAD